MLKGGVSLTLPEESTFLHDRTVVTLEESSIISRQHHKKMIHGSYC